MKPEEDAKARLIRQFSDEFFKLARSQSAELNQYLTFTEPVTLNLAGTVYRIEPADGKPVDFAIQSRAASSTTVHARVRPRRN